MEGLTGLSVTRKILPLAEPRPEPRTEPRPEPRTEPQIQEEEIIQPRSQRRKSILTQRPALLQTHNENQIELITDALEGLKLSYHQKLSIKHRFLSLLQEYTYRSKRYSNAFHILRIIISVGSLIVPALLSVQFTGGSSSNSSSASNQVTTSTAVYWVVWVLSLCVTISNAIMTLMKIDKKYYTLHTTLHQIVSEGWLYIELSGKYSGFKTPSDLPTHANQYVYFCQSLEKIRMKQVSEEYYKLNEGQQQFIQDKDQLIPPTPFKLTAFEPEEKVEVLSKEDDKSKDNSSVWKAGQADQAVQAGQAQNPPV
jgi:hypothetical protein